MSLELLKAIEMIKDVTRIIESNGYYKGRH
jgi:hypothetical protein